MHVELMGFKKLKRDLLFVLQQK